MPILAKIREHFVVWLNGHPDDWILSRLLGVVVAAAILVLAYDYYQMVAGTDAEQAGITENEPAPLIPRRPSFRRSCPSLRPGDRRVPFRKPDGSSRKR